MIQRLGWRSLEDRRRDARLTMLYKIDHELVAISKTDRLKASSVSRLALSGDSAFQSRDSSWEERHLPDINPTVWYLIGIVVRLS
jgi:hypothetical protein